MPDYYPLPFPFDKVLAKKERLKTDSLEASIRARGDADDVERLAAAQRDSLSEPDAPIEPRTPPSRAAKAPTRSSSVQKEGQGRESAIEVIAKRRRLRERIGIPREGIAHKAREDYCSQERIN